MSQPWVPTFDGAAIQDAVPVADLLDAIEGAYRDVTAGRDLSPVRSRFEIAGGDLQRRMPVPASRELHDVAATFDRLTDRVREHQAQLIRAEKLASIGRLAASVAHEIGNPLGAIFGHVHLLRQKMEADPQAGEGLDMLGALERESARIERIVRGLLDYARARPPAPVPGDVDGVVRSCVDLL